MRENFIPYKKRVVLEIPEIPEKRALNELKKIFENFKNLENQRFPEVSPEKVEKVIKEFIKEIYLAQLFNSYRREGHFFKKGDLEGQKREVKNRFEIAQRGGLVISYFIRKIVENYVKAEKSKGKEISEIADLKIKIDLEEIKKEWMEEKGWKKEEGERILSSMFVISNLGWKNPEHCYLKIIGDVNHGIGKYMEGGKIEIEGNVKDGLGQEMTGGEIFVKGNVRNYVGEKMKNGKIIIKGNAGEFIGIEMGGDKGNAEIIIKGKVQGEVGRRMKGGKIEIGDNGGSTVGPEMIGGQIIIKESATNVGYEMRGGVIKIGGKAEFHRSCFNENNKGKVLVGEKQVWPPQEKIS